MFRNLIDLNYIFSRLDDFCILKFDPDKFPEYKPNSDIDILCKDKYLTANCIEKILNESGVKLKKYIAKNNNLQIDAMNGNKLEIKFDITDDLSCFSKIKIKKDLVKLILENKIKYKSFFIPELKYDLAIRLLEYFEYKNNPEKSKHLLYCNQFPVNKKFAEEIIENNRL
tara:strand:+ start:711 stop:1220 length:510 start_codon:yes stop_codon:yes gene_type:complete